MKFFISTLILWSISFSAFGQIEKPKPKPASSTSSKPTTTPTTPVPKPKVKNGWTEKNLKGKVKSVSTRMYTATDHFGEIQKDTLIAVSNISFSLKGYCSEQKDSSFVHTHFVGNSSSVYDLEGNKTNTITYDTTGKIIYKTIYKYDENNYLTEIKNYDKDGIVTRRAICTIDLNGNLVEQIDYFADGKIASVRKSKYDASGALIEVSHYYEADLTPLTQTFFKYNSHDDMIENAFYKIVDGKLSSKPDITTTEYFYDNQGNWTKSITYMYDGSIYVHERKISYY